MGCQTSLLAVSKRCRGRCPALLRQPSKLCQINATFVLGVYHAALYRHEAIHTTYNSLLSVCHVSQQPCNHVQAKRVVADQQFLLHSSASSISNLCLMQASCQRCCLSVPHHTAQLVFVHATLTLLLCQGDQPHPEPYKAATAASVAIRCFADGRGRWCADA